MQCFRDWKKYFSYSLFKSKTLQGSKARLYYIHFSDKEMEVLGPVGGIPNRDIESPDF